MFKFYISKKFCVHCAKWRWCFHYFLILFVTFYGIFNLKNCNQYVVWHYYSESSIISGVFRILHFSLTRCLRREKNAFWDAPKEPILPRSRKFFKHNSCGYCLSPVKYGFIVVYYRESKCLQTSSGKFCECCADDPVQTVAYHTRCIGGSPGKHTSTGPTEPAGDSEGRSTHHRAPGTTVLPIHSTPSYSRHLPPLIPNEVFFSSAT